MTTIRHPLHLLDRAVMFAMRNMVASMKGSVTSPEARKPFDELMQKTPAAAGVTYEQASVGGVAGVWCRPGDAPDASAAILYFHGAPTSSDRRSPSIFTDPVAPFSGA